MNITILLLSFIGGISAVLLAAKPMIKLAHSLGLVDHPNHRKVHHKPTPLVGGIMVFAGLIVTFFLFISGNFSSELYLVLIPGAFVLLLLGMVDDIYDVRASFKLLIQIGLAYYAFINGVKIDSFYGIAGIYEIPEWTQYTLTLLVIAGSINAFNLMDGVDGLAAGLAALSFITFSILAITLNLYALVPVYLCLIGCLFAFLYFNLRKDNKIFLGDAGSLFLGYLIVISAIHLIQNSSGSQYQDTIFTAIFAVLLIPVIDSLRVYRRRLKNGNSPFKADRTHLHHLFLALGLSPKYTSVFIISFSAVIIVVSFLIGDLVGATITILSSITLFISLTFFLSFNNNVRKWREKLRKLETNSLYD